MRPTPDFKHGRQLTTVRVLLLEDDQAFAGLVRANLERVDWADLSIEHAPTMRDALAKLERGGIDLVITDLNLPDSKGLDTVESLVRATDRLILVLTGERDAGLREAVLAQGAYDIMSKDRIDRIELERLVRLATMQANTFRSLRLSEERFRSLAELSADWYWEQDAELRYVSTGGAPEARRGITGDAHVGLRRWDLPGTEILQQTWEEHRAVLAARQPFQDLLLRRMDGQGEARYLNISGRPTFDAHGTFCGYRGAAKDVTRRVQMDMRLAIEHSVTRLLAESGSIAEAAPRIIQAICETLGWACGSRWQHDAQSKLMVCAESWGIASPDIDAFLELARRRPAPLTQPGGLNRRAWAEGKPTWIRDVTREATFLRAPAAAKAGLHSALAFPIQVGAEVIGVIELFSRGIQQPEAELLECMTNVGSQIGQFMQRTRSAEELRRFRLAMDSSADIIVLIERKTMRFVDVNETACRLLGYTREELLGMTPDRLLPASREDLERAYDAFIADPANAVGMRSVFHCKDGSLLPFESTRRVLRSGDTHIIVAISRDIRERLAADEALRESEARFRSLAQLSSDMYWEQDEQFRFTSQSGTGSERMSARSFPLIGKLRWEQNYINMTADDWARHRALLEAHLPFRDLELCRLDEAGQKVWVNISGEPVFDEAGAFKGYRGVGKEITGRKRGEQLLNLEHTVTRALAEADSAAAALEAAIRSVCETEGWECGRYFRPDGKSGALRMSAAWGVPIPEIERYIAGSRELVYAPGVGLVGLVWQGGQPIWVADLYEDARTSQAALARGSGIHGAFVFPVMSEGKTIGVLAFNSREVRQPEERLLQAIHVIGSQIGQFVQRKLAENVLRESEESFRALTELSSDMYWTQDREHRFTAFAGSSKTLPLWLIGKRRWDEPSFNMTEADWAAHKAILDARLPFRDVELGRMSETGETFWVSISGAPVFDDSGNFTGYRGLSKNITARKREEQLLGLEHTVTRCLAEADDVSTAAQKIVRTVCEVMNWECGRYLSVDERAGVLRFSDGWSVPDPEIERYMERARAATYAPGAGLVGCAWQSGMPEWTADLANDPRAAKPSLSQKFGMHGAFVFPVTFEEKVIGAFSFNSRKVREPDERLLMSVRMIGSQIGQFVQRKQAEAVRRESEERFRSLTGLSSDWYWEQDENYRFTLISSTVKDATGRGPAAILGTARWDMPALNMTEADWAAHRALLDARKSFYNLELYRRTSDGAPKYTSISGEPMFDAEGSFKGYRGVGKDITERKRAEQLVMLEHTVARYVAAADNIPAMLKAAMRAVCETEDWECGRYFRVDETAGLLRFAEAWSVSGELMDRFIAKSRGLSYAPGVGLIGRVWQSGEPIWSADIAKDPRINAGIAREIGMHGSFVFPVLSEGKATGVLMFHSREIRQPDERLLQSISVIGSQIGQFVQRKLAEEVLRESEARFRSLTKLSSDFYWETDAEHRMLQTHYAGQHSPVIPRGQRFGKTRWEVPSTHPDAAGWAAHRAVLEAHQPFRDFELARVDDNGVERHLSISGEPMFDASGAFSGYRGIGKDITARKREEGLLNLEHAVARYLSEADSISGALKSVIRVVCESQGWECGRYFYADSQASLLRFGEAWGIQDAAIQRYIEGSRDYTSPLDTGSKARVWRTGEPLWTTETSRHGHLVRSTLGSARDSFVFAVISEGKSLGVLSFTSRGVRKPDERLLQAVRVIGSQIGQFLQRKQAEARQANHTRYQEKIARFGASALGKRDAVDLIEDALQAVIEALPATVVAYVEPGAGERELVVRGLTGLATGEGAGVAVYASADPVAPALERGELTIVDRPVSGAALLPFYWAEAFRGAALFPVHGDNRVQGVLCVLSETSGAFGAEESKFLVTAASVLSAGLRRIHSEGRLAFLAQFDALTGLPNRALLADRFSQMIVQARRHDKPLGVLFIDLDDFKLVNDSLGHAGGDELLKETARRLQASVRAGDTVARISGDEFAVILGDLARPDDAALVAQKIIDRLAAPVSVRGHEVFVTASIGIAAFPADGSDAEALLGAADAAMYRAKQSGRNSYQFFTADINQRTRARAQLGSELRRALERGEFALAYQPKFDLRSGRPCGAEALLRWRHPERGLVPPVEFIPVLEETGLIVQVGEWVLRRACEDLRAWQAAGLPPMQVAVNLSARQFRQQDLDVAIRDLVSAAGVAPEMIELEITESQLMQDPDHAKRVIHALSEGGIGVAIDDFGTGYSSLSYLTRFPVSALKIDRSFVAEVLSDRAAAAIVRTIIDMAHTLGFIVIAEGVETEAQALLLRGLGCEQAQGYFFARPQPEAEFRKLIAAYSADSARHQITGER